jgi:predicted TPR repeat methyltransferase
MSLLRALESSGDAIADRRLALAENYFGDRDFTAAADLARQALELVPAFAPAWFLLGEACHRAGETAGAAAAFEEVLRLDPADRQGAAARLALMGLRPLPDAMSGTYVATLFDRYAPLFEAHLLGVLHYRAPQMILAALRRAAAARGREMRFGRVVDLGCGTGLMGEEIAPFSGSLSGCDLSAEMVGLAEASGHYSGGVSVGEAAACLAALPEASVDLVLAADVLVYIADLAPLLRQVARVLAPDGLVAFSVQTHAGDGVILGADLRFHHAPEHVSALAAAAGLAIVHSEEAATRRDGGKPVPSLLVVLAHAG